MRSRWLMVLVVAVLLSTLLLSSSVFAQNPVEMPPIPSVPAVPQVNFCPSCSGYNVYVGYGSGYGAVFNGGWGYGYGVQTPYANHYGYGAGYGAGSSGYGYNYAYYGWWDP